MSRPKRKPKTPEPRIDFDRALESLDDEELPQALPVEPAPEAPPPERQVDDAIEQLLAAADTPHRSDVPLSMTVLLCFVVYGVARLAFDVCGAAGIV